MLLRRLELCGFKSFANRMKLEFGPGITALVGPNGSGKSNIADAIRWALGEQRLKSLRCEKIEDLIHLSPDKHRSPGFGEVVLVLDNTSGVLPLDYSEVEVSRRVYRSGESEFKLNRSRCRLKDIQELFMDTGLGRDTYALINQGQVESLLTMGAEDRRLMLEEAAGILKYRYRKREVLDKLKESELNITRLRDLLIELKHQLAVLEKEAEQERLYREYRQEMETGQITLALHEINSLQRQREIKIQEIQKEHCSMEAMHTKQQTIGAQIEKEKLLLHLNEEKLSSLGQELAIIQNNIGHHEESISLREARNLALQGEWERRVQQQELRNNGIAEIVTFQKDTREQIGQLKKKIATSKIELELATELMKQCQEKWQRQEERLEADRDEAFEIIRRQSEEKNKWQLLISRQKSIKHSLIEGQEQIQVIERRLSALNKENDSLMKKQKEWSSYLLETEEAIASHTMEMEKILIEAESIQAALKEKRGLLEQAQSRLKFLQGLESGFEGYYQGVQAILKNFNEGIYGTVANIIHVNKDLEKAIGVALGSTMQYLVAKNDAIAQNAIEFLLTNKMGRATFLPLNTIQAKSLPSQGRALLGLSEVLGRASDLVTTEPLYRPIAEYLLGQVILVKDLSSARLVARKGNYRFKTVSLNGEVITPGGAITGGTLAHNQIQLLGRKREIQELLEDCEILSAEAQLLGNTLTTAERKISVVNRDIEQASGNRKKAKTELDSIERAWESLGQRIKENKNALGTLQWEKESAQGILEELDRDIKQQEDKLFQLEKEDREVKDRLQKAEINLREYKKKQEYGQNSITSLKVNNASLTQQLKALEDYLEKLETQFCEAKKAMLEEEKELTILAKEKEDLRPRIALEHDILIEHRQKETELKESIEKLKMEREKSQKALSEMQAESRIQQGNIDLVGERIHHLERVLIKLEASLGEVKRRLFLDHKLSIDQAEKYKHGIIPISKWRRRVAELRKELAQFDNINLRAGDQYGQMRERYDFLTHQMDDLVGARKTLVELLEEIDSVSKERLDRTFTEVLGSFQRVFQELFGGGKAQLSLTSSDNPLEAGLEIMVQPPGKKLQNILLLSGGEKALAAIAFLFGILHVKPSPFCVLDEIDASLDDVNAVRLGNFLRRYEDKIQFLLITHRQEIIKQADILYGIAMDESGISQFLSLDIGKDMVG